MIIKTGNIVSHTGALAWGAGKVLEVSATMATIQFSDGTSRKIAASHFTTLQPAATASYIPPIAPAPAVKATRRKAAVKKIQPPVKDI